MRLTPYRNHALRTLQFAASRFPDLVRIEEVVSLHAMKRPNTVEAVHVLGHRGYLDTRRGRGGVFKLARPDEDIRVGNIVRMTDGDLESVECVEPDMATRPLIGICRLLLALRMARDAFMGGLDGVTISDTASNCSDLLGRIGAGEGGVDLR